MPKWEYKIIFRKREVDIKLIGNNEASAWNQDIQAMLPQLGIDGWELVAVTPRSGMPTESYSGFTNEELWVFKRPLENAG